MIGLWNESIGPDFQNKTNEHDYLGWATMLETPEKGGHGQSTSFDEDKNDVDEEPRGII